MLSFQMLLLGLLQLINSQTETKIKAIKNDYYLK